MDGRTALDCLSFIEPHLRLSVTPQDLVIELGRGFMLDPVAHIVELEIPDETETSMILG